MKPLTLTFVFCAVLSMLAATHASAHTDAVAFHRGYFYHGRHYAYRPHFYFYAGRYYPYRPRHYFYHGRYYPYRPHYRFRNGHYYRWPRRARASRTSATRWVATRFG